MYRTRLGVSQAFVNSGLPSSMTYDTTKSNGILLYTQPLSTPCNRARWPRRIRPPVYTTMANLNPPLVSLYTNDLWYIVLYRDDLQDRSITMRFLCYAVIVPSIMPPADHTLRSFGQRNPINVRCNCNLGTLDYWIELDTISDILLGKFHSGRSLVDGWKNGFSIASF